MSDWKEPYRKYSGGVCVWLWRWGKESKCKGKTVMVVFVIWFLWSTLFSFCMRKNPLFLFLLPPPKGSTQNLPLVPSSWTNTESSVGICKLVLRNLFIQLRDFQLVSGAKRKSCRFAVLFPGIRLGNYTQTQYNYVMLVVESSSGGKKRKHHNPKQGHLSKDDGVPLKHFSHARFRSLEFQRTVVFCTVLITLSTQPIRDNQNRSRIMCFWAPNLCAFSRPSVLGPCTHIIDWMNKRLGGGSRKHDMILPNSLSTEGSYWGGVISQWILSEFWVF